MAGPFQRRFRIALAAGAASLAVWAWVPGTPLDRAAFTTVCAAFTNPPFFVSGAGKPDAPWQLRGFTTGDQINPAKAPVVISLGDDPNNIFQASPQSPLDLAVILANLQRHGIRHPAIAAVLAWDNPDMMSFSSLEVKLAAFSSVTLAAPLSRGAIPEPMPAAFRRASIPLEKVRGDTTALPIVNRVPVSGVVLGGENCSAGFQSIDSENPGEHPSLLARWDDRVVFSFPLVAAMQHLTISPQQVEIRLGKWVKLDPKGPTLPIDRFGRLTISPPVIAAKATILAEDLIDAAPGLIPDADESLVCLRDDHSAADPATRGFSSNLAAITTAIISDAGLGSPSRFDRLKTQSELITLGLLALVAAWLGGRPRFQQTVGFLAIAGVCLASQWIAAGSAQVWLPGIAALGGVFTAALLGRFLPENVVVSSPVPIPEPAPEPVAEPEPPPEPAPKAARKPRATKTAKKTAPVAPPPPASEPMPEEKPVSKSKAKTTPPKARKTTAKKAAQKRGKPKN